MTDKEQIIINGEKEDCKILFRCKHIDDLAAYNMIRNGIKITPENAPIGDFELMLIENTDSPFGFSSVCKRNNKEDVWEYSGFGHSGACSIVTALLKRLDRKTQEFETICKAFDIEYGYDEETGAIIGRCNKLIEKEKVLEEYKQSLDEKNKFLQDLGISASGEFKRIKFYIEDLKNKYNEKVEECEELKERKLKLELNENHNKNEIKKLKKRIRKDREFFKNKISSLTLARKEFLEALDHFNWQIGLVKNDSYRKALEKIEEVCIKDTREFADGTAVRYDSLDKILDIINKAKDGE